MAQSTCTLVNCYGPDETQLKFRAVFGNGLDVNVLTPWGLQRFGEFAINKGSEIIPQCVNGISFTVRDTVRLVIWGDGSARSQAEDFYIPLEEEFDIQTPHNPHAILGQKCFLSSRDTRGNGASIAPIEVRKLSKGVHVDFSSLQEYEKLTVT
ncbi:hypothetical protein BBP40_001199 [Aspergillus hancockii]|nr:hypothetical protein BBP40_001199 [Aspergillus hancockii]